MSLPSVTFIKGQGGLGRVLAGEDYISGIIFYDATKPSGFSSGSSYVQKVLNLVEAETLGIVNTYSDETKATASITVTASGATNDTLNITVTDFSGVVDLGTYTSTGLAINAEATAIAAFINAGNYSHGYTATANTATVTITAPAGKGIALNTGTPLTTTTIGTLTVTKVQFANGVASKLAQYHYQVSEFFRLQPSGQLWIMFSDVPATYFATEIATLQAKAEGKLRQVAIFAQAKTSITTGDITAINNAVVATETTFGVSLSVLYACDLMGVTNLNTLPDLSQLTANKVSVIISQSMSGEGLYLYNTVGKSIPTLGACLGNVALAKVSEDIAWVGAYNVSDGTECEVAGFANNQTLSSVSNALLEQLNGFRYIFLRKFIGTTGTFWNDSNVAISTASDYAYIENNRTIDKAIRVVRTALMPNLNSPLDLNSDGTLTDVTIASWKGLSNFVLENMFRNGELSAYSTEISAVQNVLSTSTINIVINIIPRGVARNIVVTIGFKTKLT